jgi:hypothetical protein
MSADLDALDCLHALVRREEPCLRSVSCYPYFDRLTDDAELTVVGESGKKNLPDAQPIVFALAGLTHQYATDVMSVISPVIIISPA